LATSGTTAQDRVQQLKCSTAQATFFTQLDCLSPLPLVIIVISIVVVVVIVVVTVIIIIIVTITVPVVGTENRADREQNTVTASTFAQATLTLRLCRNRG
jgi:uncharacterized membrane protein